MGLANLYAAWMGMFLGCVAGAVQGLCFYKEDWLGGYSSWPRRMVRLGHISFFGIGFINLVFSLTVYTHELSDGVLLASRLLILGAITMPLVCYLSAAKKFFRHLFFIPAISVIAGIALLTWRLFQG
jgi:hypothetical protein